MNRLNNAPILDQTEGERDKLLMIALWKLNGDKAVKITAADIAAFTAAHGGMGVLFMHGHADSIELSIIDPARAAAASGNHGTERTTLMERNQIPALPEYVCHKRVQAARIASIQHPDQQSESRIYTLMLDTGADKYLPLQVPVDYINKHEPQPGGYFVRYDDGYSSYSPAKAFEEGYSRTSNPEPITLEQLRHNEQVAAEWRAAQTAVGVIPGSARLGRQALHTAGLASGVYDPLDPKHGGRGG